MYKIIVSITTSPNRIKLLEPMIQSVLLQDYEVFRIEINVPEKYKNREEYEIPEYLSKYEKVHIYRTGPDIGPATKIVPTIMRYLNDPEVYIVSLDDDHRYPNKMVSTLLKGLVAFGSANVYTIGGINIYPGPNNTLITDNVYKTAPVDVLEGVFGVLYNPRLFKEDLMVYMNTVIQCKECLTSDDITLSNYLASKGIPIIRLNFKSFNKLILYKQILFKKLAIKAAEKDGNAIHLMPGGHRRRYFDACKWLNDHDMFYLKVRRGKRY